MNGEPRKSPKVRMIHIRLDDKIHRQLKVDAAQNDSSIQQLVESLIRRRYANSRARKSNS